MENVAQRFLRYIAIDTQSADGVEQIPSTKKQFTLARLLVDEMQAMGIADARVDAHGYVYGSIPATAEGLPALGFIAHMDTSPDAPGCGVRPRIVRNYPGGDIPLNAETTIAEHLFPALNNYIGNDIIVTDGTTLLGADDKAGIAEILALAEALLAHPEQKRGRICFAFTPDEEVGCGADLFDVPGFGADFAYTVDGGAAGELEYENFNAAAAKITFKGLNVHPGYAKNKMLNASLLAIEFASWLPASQRPEHTQGYEGFYHLTNMSGTVEEASLSYIIRDHVRTLFEEKKAQLKMWVKRMNEIHPGSTTLELRDQYYNMREVVEPKKYIVDLAFEAMESVGVKPLVKPIRGGTDGARLSFMGLPCPNIFAGGLNFHGRYEFLPVNSLEKSMQTIIKITELLAQKS